MRKVFPKNMVAHVWAQRTQDEGRSSTGNFYFVGDTIYSYGRHFPIAKFVDLPNGESVVLFTSRSYSITTSSHIAAVRQSLRGGQRTFVVTNPAGGIDEILDDLQDKANAAHSAAQKPRIRQATRDNHMAECARLIRQYDEMAELWGSPRRLNDLGGMLAECRAAEERAEQERLRREEERRQEIQSRQTEVEEWKRDWLAGEVHFGHSWYHGPTLLRIKDGRIQTSRGAEIPVRCANAIWELVCKCLDSGEPAYPAMQIGHFTLDTVKGDGSIVAGCHVIEHSELRRIAVELGLVREGVPA